jgi:hypothetical protein
MVPPVILIVLPPVARTPALSPANDELSLELVLPDVMTVAFVRVSVAPLVARTPLSSALVAV